jgi:HPt (histidine-containing phosphotransfer) domain-containing protein
MQKIDAAKDAGDSETIHRLIHTIKGTAGLLGATSLSMAAREAENALYEEKAIKNLNNEFKKVMEEITEFLSSRAMSTN